MFSVARPFFPRDLFERFRFVDNINDLSKEGYVATSSLPERLGGTNRWSLETYVQSRCLQEGTICHAGRLPELGGGLDERRNGGACVEVNDVSKVGATNGAHLPLVVAFELSPLTAQPSFLF